MGSAEHLGRDAYPVGAMGRAAAACVSLEGCRTSLTSRTATRPRTLAGASRQDAESPDELIGMPTPRFMYTDRAARDRFITTN